MPAHLSLFCQSDQEMPFSEIKKLLEVSPYPALDMWRDERAYFNIEHKPIVEPVPPDPEQWREIGFSFPQESLVSLTRYAEEYLVKRHLAEICASPGVSEELAQRLNMSHQQFTLTFPWSWAPDTEATLVSAPTPQLRLIKYLATSLARQLNGFILYPGLLYDAEFHLLWEDKTEQEETP